MSNYRQGYSNNAYRSTAGYRVGAYGDGTYSTAVVNTDVTWTRTPDMWFSANDVNLTFNSGISDGAALATWKNKGTTGATWDAVQGTGGNQPLFKLVSASGKMANKPAVRFDGIDDYMASAVVSTQAQPATWIVVGKGTGSGNQVWFSGSATNRNQIYTATLAINMYAGSVAGLIQNITAGTYHCLSGIFTGAASTGALDGTTLGAINPGTAAFDQIGIGAGPAYPSSPAAVDILQLAVFIGGSQPSHAQMAASVAAYYGATPQ